MEQFVLVPASLYMNKCLKIQTVTEQELPMYQTEQNPTYQSDSLKEENNRKQCAKADSLVDKILSCPRIKLSNSQILNLDCVETGGLLSVFPQNICRENADIPNNYFILLGAAGIFQTLVSNQNAKFKERGTCVPPKIWMPEATKAVHTGYCCLRFCSQFSGR